MTLLSPGQEVQELAPKVVTIQGASVGAKVFVGVTVKGPMGLGGPVFSWDQFVEQYGGFTENGWVAYAVYSTYQNEPGAKVYVVRVAHYSDITDAGTLTAKASSVTLNDRATTTPVPTLKVSASSPGKWGDNLKVKIADNGTNKFDLEVYETVNGSDVLRDKFTGLTMDPTDTQNYVEYRVNGKGRKYIVVEDQSSATAAPDNRPAVGTFPLAGGDDGLTDLDDTDFIGDPTSRTGLYAMNTLDELFTFAVPGKTTSAVHNAMIAYAEGRKDCYFVLDLPFGLTAQEAADYRQTTLGANTDYGEANWPHLVITDPLTKQRKTIPNSGFVMGAMGRTFAAKGAWKAAAGVEDGRLFGAIALETDEVNDRGARDILYQAQINPIYFVPNYGICKFGSLTLAVDGNKLQHVNQRWTFLYCEDSIKRGTMWELFENIDTNLMKKAERTIKAFLLGVWRDGGLKGDRPQDAFYVQVDLGNNPESETSKGNLRHRIGLAIHTPANFVYFEFERDQRALEAELAAAQ